MNLAERKTILLVEDEIIIALAETKSLEKYGYRIFVAHNGESAIEIAGKTPALDLILMDINLGKGIDGTEAALMILKDRSIPIVFLSSHEEQEVVAKTEKITSYGYVVKNSSITVLNASIKMALKLFEAKKKSKEKDDKLQESEERYALINNSSSDSIYSYFGLSGRFASANQNLCDTLQLEPYQIIGKTHAELGFPEKLCKEWEKMHQQVYATDRMVSSESIVLEKDGLMHNYEVVLNPLHDHLGGIIGIGGITRDITDRKKAEEALRVSEIRYRRLFESAKDGILILDAETGKIMDVNPFLIDLLGYSKDEFIEKTIWEIGYFKDIVANKDKFEELQDKEYVRYEDLPLETANGHKIHVEFVSNVYLVNNHKVIQCNIRDNRDRKITDDAQNASEIRYRRLFESAKDGILILDAKTGKIMEVNPFLIDLLGYSREQFIEKAIWEIGFFKDIVANKDKFLELQEKEYVRYEDLPLETADGRKINVEFVSNVYLVNNLKVIQCSIRDNTARKMADEKIKGLLQEKGLILKEVHHRINNNMNTLKSLLTLQADTLKDPSAISALQDAGNRVQSMMVLYHKLYQSTDFNAVSLKDYLPALVKQIVHNFPNCEMVKLDFKIDDLVIETNKLSPLGIIINELITNIMKYAFLGRTEGLISVKATLSGNKVTLIIQDNGNGIPDSIDFANSPGFGLMLIGILTKQLDGTIRKECQEGTKVILEFEK